MKAIALLSICLVLCACQIPLTPGGKNILIVRKPGDLPQGCARGATYSARSRFGAEKPINSIRNKVAAQSAGDTLLLSSIEHGNGPGTRRVSAIAFTCGKWWETTPDKTDKASKCQAKGGIWTNEQCVLQLE